MLVHGAALCCSAKPPPMEWPYSAHSPYQNGVARRRLAQRRVEVTLKFDPEQKGTLLGKNGSTINRIQQESTGAQLEISKGEECSIRVWGPSAAVVSRLDQTVCSRTRLLGIFDSTHASGQAKARAALVQLLYLDAKSIQVHYANQCQPSALRLSGGTFSTSSHAQVVEVPTELVDLVVGRGSEKLKKLEEEHAVRIDLSRPADRSEVRDRTF